MATGSPRFFGFVVGSALPVAIAADWLTSTWDQNAGLFTLGPAAAVVEEVAGDWLLDLLGLPPTASFAVRHRLPDGPRHLPGRRPPRACWPRRAGTSSATGWHGAPRVAGRSAARDAT